MDSCTRKKTASSFGWSVGSSLALLVALQVASLAQAATPAQLPLLGRIANPAAPNIVYTLDDSGSMAWRYMPDSVSPWSGNDRWWISFHPGDVRSTHESYDHWSPSSLKLFSTRDNDLVSARLRSSAFNTIYYNPEVRYQPWFNSDGTQWPNASSTAARLNPNNADWGTVNLEGTINHSGQLCRSTATSTSVTCNSVSDELIVPGTYYQYNGGGFNSAANFTRVHIKDHATFSRGEARTDCTPVAGTGTHTCTRAQEFQNFANWFVYNRTRMYLAIAATSQAFSAQGDEMRVGYGRIGKTTSSTVDGVSAKTVVRGVRKFSGTDRTGFFNWLYDAPTTASTHLRRALGDVGQYYSRDDDRGPWGNTPGTEDPSAHLACRKSYNILMTDGYWNGDQAGVSAARANVDNQNGPTITNPAGGSYQYTPAKPFQDNASNTLADVAMYYWNRDLRPTLANRVKPDTQNPAFWQHMVNFTVGLGVDGTLNFPDDLPALQSGAKAWPDSVPGESPSAIDDLWHAAVNSRGRYLSATDASTFSAELSKVLEEIVSRNASEAGIAVANRVLQVGNRKYLPTYITDQWTGDVTAIELDATGQQLSPVWSAASKIPADTARNIFVGNRATSGTRAIPFDWSLLPAAMRTEMGTGANSALVNYLRGNPALEGSTYRRRLSRLGDIVNSQPTYVGSLVNMRYNLLPKGTAGADTYTAFLQTKKARPGMLFVGANDGMLHAFRGSDGVEAFAFIPRSLLPTLGVLAAPSYGHRYYVDGPLTESDAYWGGAWRNVLVGSTGAGSRAVFALDVTSTTSMNAGNVLWELDSTQQAELGHVLAPIEVGLMKNGKWAAVFGNGYGSAAGKAQLFVVDLQTGAVIRRIDTGVADGNGLGGVRLIRDGNQVIVGAYAGDLKGNVWKFDLSSTSASSWKIGIGGAALYATKDAKGVAQPITAAPALVAHPRGGNMVLVGTGKLFEEGDQASVAPQSLYGLWDKQSLVESSGAWQWTTEGAITSTSAIKSHAIETTTISGANGETYYSTITPAKLDWDTDRGWTLPLTIMTSQRNSLPPRLLLGMALFETIAPLNGTTAADACNGSEAQGFNLLLDPISGAMSQTPVTDVNGDGTVDANDPPVAGWAAGAWNGSSSWLSEATPTVPKDCTANPAACLCPAGTKQMRGIGADAGSMPVCFSVPPPTRWWWRQLMVH